jgi:hypothetical protein
MAACLTVLAQMALIGFCQRVAWLLCLHALVLVVMSGAASSTDIVPARRRDGRPKVSVGSDVGRELVSKGHTNKSIVDTLKTLADAGMIKDIKGNDADITSLKRQLTEMSAEHGNANTPYGKVIQRVKLDAPGAMYWEYVNPFAFLFYLSSLSSSFAAMMRSIAKGATPLRIVIYADGLVPGNPFRPEASRKLQCIYWCIVDWPQHVLQRSFAWPVFSIIKESVLKAIAGGLGCLMRTVLRIFFGESGNSFSRGVHINDSQGGFVVTAIFAGFLQDLVGHKELSDWKGHGGLKCCLTCDNVINMRHRGPRPGEVATNCWDTTKFDYRSNEGVYAIIDGLKVHYEDLLTKPRFPKTTWEKSERDAGFNLVFEGILLDTDLRHIYKPVDHTIRDWQHTLAQDGVANTHVAALLHRLKTKGIGIERVQTFSQLVNYPSAIGKLDQSAFGPSRMRADTIFSFSSIMVTMVSVLHFFVDIFAATIVPDEHRAFTKLHHIIGILRMGPEDAMGHVQTLRTLMSQHLEAFCELYPDVNIKPKMHHIFHIPDGMDWLGKLLSCFVTERKHKMIKRAALYIFRNLEHTVLTDVVNTTFQQVISGHDLYSETFLIMPHDCEIGGLDFRRSRAACCRIGHVAVGDLVVNVHGCVGCIVCCWQKASDNLIVLEVDAYPCLNDDVRFVSKAQASKSFFELREIVDSLIWIEESPGIIRICLPPALLYRD